MPTTKLPPFLRTLAVAAATILHIPILAAAAPAAADRLAPFAYLAGGTWTVVDDASNAPTGVVTEYSFEFVLDGKFIQSRHSATRDNKKLSSSISYLGWDAAKQCVAQWGFNNVGMTAVLYAAPDASEESFTLEGTLGSGERAPRIRTTYRRIAEHEIEVRTDIWRKGEFVPMGTARLRRH